MKKSVEIKIKSIKVMEKSLEIEIKKMKIKRDALRGLPKGSPILVLLSPKHA